MANQLNMSIFNSYVANYQRVTVRLSKTPVIVYLLMIPSILQPWHWPAAVLGKAWAVLDLIKATGETWWNMASKKRQNDAKVWLAGRTLSKESFSEGSFQWPRGWPDLPNSWHGWTCTIHHTSTYLACGTCSVWPWYRRTSHHSSEVAVRSL